MIKNRQLWITFLSQQNIKIKCIILEERPVQTTDNTSQTEKLQNTVENNEVHLQEVQMPRERKKQLEEASKISSNSSDIIHLSG